MHEPTGGIDAVHLTTVHPARAASDRAKRRRDALMMSFEEGMEGDELAAEAEYDDIPVSSRWRLLLMPCNDRRSCAPS